MAKAEISGIKVWLIDDDQVLLEMISIILKSTGMEVHSFSDPQEAINSFKKGCANLLKTDIQMPVINGVEVLKQIKKKNGGEIKAVAISGRNAGENEYAGFSAYIQKPFKTQTLIDVISGQMKEVPVIDNQEARVNLHKKRYNLEQFAAFAAGDPEGVKQILVSFINSGNQNATLFRQYLHEENDSAISELSHKMLTLFRQLEAYDIVDLLDQLEQKDFAQTNNKQYYSMGNSALEKIEALLLIIEKEQNIKVD